MDCCESEEVLARLVIPYGRHEISEADIDAVVEVLRSDFLTQGPMVPHFEKLVANYCGSDYAVAVNSATSALHLACLALELGPGDRVWTSPITFVASANCGLYCGAVIDFVDISPFDFNMSVTALTEKLEFAAKMGTLPKIVIPVHLAGQSCDMASIYALSQKYGFKIIEDASHAIGGRYNSEPIGSCRFSDITVFSFHPVKIITSAEGGMAVTNDVQLADKMALLRSHGITRDEKKMTRPADGAWYYEQIALGFNYRLTDLHAALGVSQLKRLDQFVSRRHEIANIYHYALRDLLLALPAENSGTYSSYHLYIVSLIESHHVARRGEIFEALRKQGVMVNLHYIPVHMQPYFTGLGFKKGSYPVAEDFYQRALSIPIFPSLTQDQQSYVVNCLHDILK